MTVAAETKSVSRRLPSTRVVSSLASCQQGVETRAPHPPMWTHPQATVNHTITATDSSYGVLLRSTLGLLPDQEAA